MRQWRKSASSISSQAVFDRQKKTDVGAVLDIVFSHTASPSEGSTARLGAAAPRIARLSCAPCVWEMDAVTYQFWSNGVVFRKFMLSPPPVETWCWCSEAGIVLISPKDINGNFKKCTMPQNRITKQKHLFFKDFLSSILFAVLTHHGASLQIALALINTLYWIIVWTESGLLMEPLVDSEPLPSKRSLTKKV